MKKFVLVAVIAGVVYAIFAAIYCLISRVADYRFTSFLFGAVMFVFWEVFGNLEAGPNQKIRSIGLVKVVLFLAIMTGVAFVIFKLFALVTALKNADFDPSFGWLMLGFVLCAIAKSIVDSLRKGRKARLAEEQRKARVAELMNKPN